jgi:flagellar M-ring protein FliF
MTENVTYQSSRLIKHTKIPQGVIRRMSLSVLVGQPIHWEGSGKNRKRVVQPPSPETMKTIREVVAGVTGFSEERGDQLIVETLPFESSLAADPQQYGAPSIKPPAQPAWLDAIDKYRNAAFLAMGGLVFLALLIGMVRYYMPRRALLVSAKQVTEELVARQAGDTMPEPGLVEEARRLNAQSNADIAGRVRKLAQGDPMLSATILRMWLHAQKPEALVKSEI